MEEIAVCNAYDAGLVFIPNEVRDDVLSTHGDTNFSELKTMAQPFICDHIRVVCSKFDILTQFVYLMKDCEGDMQWSSFYGCNEFRSSCLKAHELDLMVVFNLCQSAVRTSSPFNEHYWACTQTRNNCIQTMEYNLMPIFSTNLPSDFHPTMSVEDGVVVVSDGVSTRVYKINDNNFQEHANLNVGQVTSFHCDPDISLFSFGKANGQIALWSEDNPDIITNVLEADAPVTALISGYVAHGRVVGKLAPGVVYGDDDLYGADNIEYCRFERTVTVPGNEPVTFMHNFENTLLCFAGNNIYQYNASTLQNNFANEIRPIERGSLLCLAHDKYVVYPTGIYKPFDYNGRYHLEIIEEFNNGDYDVKAVSACAFGNYVAILFDNRVLSISTEQENRMRQVVNIEVEALGQLCGPRWGHEFTLISRDKIIRYGLSGQEVSATEESDSSSDSSDEEAELPVGPRPGFLNESVPMWGGELPEPLRNVPTIFRDFRTSLGIQTQQMIELRQRSERREPEPFSDSAEGASSAAGGRGTKRPASDPHSVKAEILRLMQEVSKEDRIALLKELKDEECPVCQERYNHPDDEEKDPVVGKCGHTVCKTCEPKIKTIARENHEKDFRTYPDPQPKCPKCRRLWQRASIELLFV